MNQFPLTEKQFRAVTGQFDTGKLVLLNASRQRRLDQAGQVGLCAWSGTTGQVLDLQRPQRRQECEFALAAFK